MPAHCQQGLAALPIELTPHGLIPVVLSAAKDLIAVSTGELRNFWR
jgi:hypothetical protein